MPLDVEAFASLHHLMERHVRERGVGGVAWAVSIGERSVGGSQGWLDPGPNQRMPDDAVFRISSVSKPIVAVAALQLVEGGLIGLDDPIDEVLPELADRRVLTDPTGPLDQPTVAADRPLTLRDLLTFRCGLGMDFDFDTPQPLLERLWELEIGPAPTPPACGPDEFLARLAELPLADQPGTRWRYHVGSDIVSVLIERLRGEPLDVVMARDVLGPARMVDTGFWVRPEQTARFGSCRQGGDDGVPFVWDEPDGRWASPPRFRSGAAGLVSTTADLLAFGRMLLAGGAAPDGRVLADASVAEMVTDQLANEQRRQACIDAGSGPLGWGLGLAVYGPRAAGTWPAQGCYGWDGGLGSRWIVDPHLDLCAVLLATDAQATPTPPPLLAEFFGALAEICATA